MSQPRISQLKTWERHIQLVREVLLAALAILRTKQLLPSSETDLNRELYFCLLQGNRMLLNSGRGFDHGPVLDGKNPPDPGDLHRAARENKIPDFNWGFIDHTEPDPRRSARYFFIECKILGCPRRRDWVFNENYVRDGIMRFITEEHAYAKGEKAGAMVGYIQSMELNEILAEVNNIAATESVAPLMPSKEDWQEHGIDYFEHHLERPFYFSPFHLQHYWVDMRTSWPAISRKKQKSRPGPSSRPAISRKKQKSRPGHSSRPTFSSP